MRRREVQRLHPAAERRGSLALGAIVAAALVEAVTSLPVHGVESRHATSSAAGYELDVRYASVSRPAVARW